MEKRPAKEEEETGRIIILASVLAKPKNTGLYFGSFNPVHVGHLIIASHMKEYGGLDEVWFIISPQNPLKKKTGLLDDHHRLAMVQIAVEDNPAFKASNVEFSLPQPSYTIHTLSVLSEKYPDRNFSLIMGSDNLQTFGKWKNYEAILDSYKILVYPRPGSDGGVFREHPAVRWIEAPLMQISSTFIRDAVRKGKSVRYLLPERIFEYLTEMHFYKKS
jgi:nicotinate-nucleotide adenylyltransferase